MRGGQRRQRHLDQDLVGLEDGGEQAGEEVAGLDPALAARALEPEAGAERHGHGRQLGGGIGVGQAAAEGARGCGSADGR